MRRPLAVTALLALAACGGDDDAQPADSPPTSAALRPAGEVLAEQAMDDAVDVGASATVDPLNVTITDMTAAADDGGFRLAVTMRVENRSDEAQSAPEMGIVCTGNPDEGGYQADSTMIAGEELPPGTFIDATQYLLLPGDSRIEGEDVPVCVEPAVVVVEGVGMFIGEQPSASWRIPPGVLPSG